MGFFRNFSQERAGVWGLCGKALAALYDFVFIPVVAQGLFFGLNTCYTLTENHLFFMMKC